MNQPLLHTTVLLDEAVDALLGRDPARADGAWIDATFGRGGHSRLILQRMGAQARLLAFDKDPEAIAEAARGGHGHHFIGVERTHHLASPFTFAWYCAKSSVPRMYWSIQAVKVSRLRAIGSQAW